MKFLVTWRVHDEHRHETLEAFSKMSTDDEGLGDGVTLIGRWHDVVSFTGVAICESDDPRAVTDWLLNWNATIDIDVTPVLDDEETRAVWRARS